MRSKIVDTAVPKFSAQSSCGSLLLPATWATLTVINFYVSRSGIYRIGHYVNAHRDNSVSLIALWRQLLLDSVSIYAQNEVGVSSTPYSHMYSSGEYIKGLSAGAHVLVLNAQGTVANVAAVDEAYTYVQEL